MPNRPSFRIAAAAFLFPICLSCLLSCSVTSSEGTVVWMENKGAIMPLWFLGPESSDTVVLFLHGGPGGIGTLSAYARADERLRQSVIMAYWDQRGSGSSRGNPDDSTFTLAQFVEDADLAVETVRSVYPGKRVFMMGESWGGELAAAYVASPARQAKLAGWIIVDGSFDEPGSDALCQQWMIDRAGEKIAAGLDVSYFTAMRDWLVSHPGAVASYYAGGETDRLKEYLVRTNAYAYNPEITDGSESHYVEMALLSPVNILGWLSMRQKAGPLLARNSPGINLTAELASVTIPTLVLWGRHDGRIPVDFAQIAYDAVSTPAPAKRLVIFENSAHFPSCEETDAFCDAVLDFVR